MKDGGGTDEDGGSSGKYSGPLYKTEIDDELILGNEKKKENISEKLPGTHIFIESCHLKIKRELRNYAVLALHITCEEAEVQEQRVISFAAYKQ